MSAETPARSSSWLPRWLAQEVGRGGPRWHALVAAVGLFAVCVAVWTAPLVAAVAIAALAVLMLVRAVQAVIYGVGGRRPDWASFIVGVVLAVALGATSFAALTSWNPALLSVIAALFGLSFLWDAIVRDVTRATSGSVAGLMRGWGSINAAALATAAGLLAGGLALYELLGWAGRSELWIVLAGLSIASLAVAVSIYKLSSTTTRSLRDLREELERMKDELHAREDRW